MKVFASPSRYIQGKHVLSKVQKLSENWEQSL